MKTIAEKCKFSGIRLYIMLFSMFVLLSSIHAQELRKIENTSFKRGEYLKYKVYYDSYLTGEVLSGEVEFEISKDNKVIAGRNTMHVVVNGQTKGLFNLFFKVKDRYETFIDEEAIIPWLFIRRVNEGGYLIEQDVSFNQYNSTTQFKDYTKKITNTSSIPKYTQDLLSAIYYSRTLDLLNAKEGDGFPVQFSLDDTVYTTKFFHQGKETIKTETGTYRCIKVKPMVLTGNVFKDPFPMMLWVTDDENRIPIFAKSEILVGSVKLELIKYSGINNPMTSRIDTPKKK